MRCLLQVVLAMEHNAWYRNMVCPILRFTATIGLFHPLELPFKPSSTVYTDWGRVSEGAPALLSLNADMSLDALRSNFLWIGKRKGNTQLLAIMQGDALPRTVSTNGCIAQEVTEDKYPSRNPTR